MDVWTASAAFTVFLVFVMAIRAGNGGAKVGNGLRRPNDAAYLWDSAAKGN